MARWYISHSHNPTTEYAAMSDKLVITTYPNATKADWLEVGQFKTYEDDFGDIITEWRMSDLRYPHRDKRLTVKRELTGKGVHMSCKWTIEIPDNYPLTIMNKSITGNYDVLWGNDNNGEFISSSSINQGETTHAT